MANKQALRPEIFTINGFIQDKEAEKQGVTAEEQVLAAGAGQQFWGILKKHINNQLEVLDALNDSAIAQGLSIEEIGRNTIVISQTKGVIRKIFNVVDDAVEAVDEAHGKTE